MVEIAPGAFQTSLLILTFGQNDYYCIEIKINMIKRVGVLLVAYSIPEDMEVPHSRAVILTPLGVSSWMLRTSPLGKCPYALWKRLLGAYQIPSFPVLLRNRALIL